MTDGIGRKTFEGALDAIQKEEDLSCQFDSGVSAMISYSGGTVVGLGNGKIFNMVVERSITVMEMTSENGENSSDVTCLAMTPDESRVVSGYWSSGEIRVYKLAERREEFKFEGHTNGVNCLAITPNGLRVVSGSRDNTVRVWNLAERSEESKFEGHYESVTCIAITPDGSRVVSGDSDGIVLIYNLAKRCEESKLEGHTADIICLAISLDGSRVVSGSRDKTVRVYNLAEGREESKFEGHTDSVRCLAITPDGSRVVSGSGDKTIRVYHLSEQREESKFEGHTDNVWCLAITPDGSRVISGSWDKTIRVYNLAERREESMFEGHTQNISCLAITLDGSRVVSGYYDNTVRVYNFAERREEFKFEGHTNSITSLAMTQDGSRIVSGSYDRTVRVYNFAERREESKFEGHTERVNCVAITPDGSRVVSGSDDTTVRVWNLAERKEESKFEGHTAIVWCLAITPDGSRVVSGSEDRTVRVYNVAKRREESKFEGHTERVNCLVITPDGLRVISGSYDRTVRVYNVAERREESKFEGHTAKVKCLAITPDGSRVVSGSDDTTVRVYNLAERREEFKFERHTDSVSCIAITPDGSRVVSGSDDKTVRVYNLAEQREVSKFEGHTDSVNYLAITPDGSRVVSNSGSWSNGEIRVYNLSERREEFKFEGHSYSVGSLAITPDGSRVLSVLGDNTVCIYYFPDTSFCPDSSRPITSSQPTFHSIQLHFTPSDFKSAIEFWKTGQSRTLSIAKSIHPSLFFNSLHVFAHFNQSVCLAQHLKDGVPLIRGVFGSPLSIALLRNSIKCTDVILQHFIELVESDLDCWAEFRVINDDLPDLLACQSSLLVSFFGVLMYTPTYLHPLPDFIKPIYDLPVTRHITSRFIEVSDFHNKDGETSELLVKFRISLPRWNFTSGSNQSIKLLSAFENCENKLVLVTPYVSTVIEEKWSIFYPFTLSVTVAYFLLLSSICCILYVDWGSYTFLGCFLFLNAIFVLYEWIQFIATGREYLADYWNWLDGVRSSLSTLWAILLLLGYSPVKSQDMKRLTLIVVVMCFIRGFTYFRSFKMTRIFVYMTLAVVKEMYSFLFILGYSVLAFGIFSSVLLEIDTIGDSWASAYNLLMGNFDNTFYHIVEWVVFTGATVTNVVIMLNLLVSILGEAYEKTQMSIRENDLHQQLTLILEYEMMMAWRRRNYSSGTVIVTCKTADDAGEALEWSGQILQITETIQSALETNFYETEKQITGLKGKITGLEGKIDERVIGLEGKVIGLEGKVTGLEGKIDEKIAGLEGKIDEKVAGLEGQLQTILGLLQAKS